MKKFPSGTGRLVQCLKWHGGKHYLAPKFIDLMPPHQNYVEPYFGGGSVLLKKDPAGIAEVVNDLDGELTSFWRVMQDPQQFEKFVRVVNVMPFSEAEFDHAFREIEPEDKVARAIAFFVRNRMSRAGNGKGFAPMTKNRTRGGMNEQASAFLGAVDGLPAICERLRRVVILNEPAVDVIRKMDTPKTLFYLDPPYLHETRASKNAYGPFEMSDENHRELLTKIKVVEGMVMLSGYPSPLYESMLGDWHCEVFDMPNHAAGGLKKARETECVWMNFDPPKAAHIDSAA